MSLRTRISGCFVGTALLAAALPASAGPCTAAGDETGNIVLLAQELAFPTWFGGSSGFLEPFATLYQSSLGYTGLGCTGSCPFSGDYGDVTCGDLVADPLSHFNSRELVGIPDPQAYTQLAADLLPEARWSLAAVGYISPATGGSQTVTRTYADFQGGFRDVLDVSSAQTTPQPVTIDFFIGRSDHGGAVGCVGDILQLPAFQTVHFRVRQDPVGPALPVTLIDASTTYGTLEVGHNEFEIDVSPNAEIYVDVYQAAQVQATGANYLPTSYCSGGYTTLDTRLDGVGTLDRDGLQVFLSPAETLTIESRGGLTYLPEPGLGAACGAGVLGLIGLIGRGRTRAVDRER